MTMRTGFKQPTQLDIECRNNLIAVVKPEFHHLIPKWMESASDSEKAGIRSMHKICDPPLMKSIGRPTGPGAQPSIVQSPWYFSKLQPGRTTMGRSSSSPYLGGAETEWSPPTWMHEDAAIIAEIPKPGGYVIQLKDTIEIQRLKNTKRNTGTYQLFSGSFHGQSVASTAHTLEAVGQSHLDL